MTAAVSPDPALLSDEARLEVLRALLAIGQASTPAARLEAVLEGARAIAGARGGWAILPEPPLIAGRCPSDDVPDALAGMLAGLADGEQVSPAGGRLVARLPTAAGDGALLLPVPNADEATQAGLALLARLAAAPLSAAPAAAAAAPAVAARSRDSLKHRFAEIKGQSPALLETLATLDKVVASEIPVLIQGESGTGKELFARAIHTHGPRKDKPYVTENCAALTETLLESEMFGYVRGAFTGAHKDKKGLFELADGGTLFLDEVGDMSLSLQKKVLRALQEGEIRPVGGKKVKHVDVRIISATNRPLKQMISEGTFREDLYYRLNVVNLRLPPLRERREDIPMLLEHFIDKVAQQYKMPPKSLTAEARDLLCAYDWPGNVREMENEVNRMLFMGDDPIEADVLSDAIQG